MAKRITRPNLRLLRFSLDPGTAHLLREAAWIAEDSDVNLWLVGGPLRDLAAGLPVRDLDFATDADAEMLAQDFARVLTGSAFFEPRFGTAHVVVGERRADFARLRGERYVEPGALPDVGFEAELRADLGRRDFTVNALALGVGGTERGILVDPYDGLDDLEAGRLRILHPDSFRDDATRLWRAGRFAARLDLEPDAETAAHIATDAHYLAAISAQRLWREFERVAGEPRAAEALALLERWGVLAATHPALRVSPEAQAALDAHEGPHSPLTLFALLTAQLSDADRASLAERIAAPKAAIRASEDAARLLALDPADLDALERIEDASDEARAAAFWLDPERQDEVQSVLERWQHTQPHLDAYELQQMGIRPGRGLGTLLRELRRARYLGTLDGVAAAAAFVRSRTAERTSP